MAKGRIHVYVGPTCPAEEIRERFPEVVTHPPVSHGDFFSPQLVPGDVAVVIDGFYHHRLGARHKEYLHALDRGVTVIGAASIGALRAVELSAFGMRGFGAVHELYRSGVFDGDDAVAVAHQEEAPYASLSVPLVNLRAAAQAARAAGLLARGEADGVVAALRREYYPSRTPARVRHILRGTCGNELAQWYERQLADDPYVFDQKRWDCLAALAAARHLLADGAVGKVTGAGVAEWRTVFLRTWSNHFAGLTGTPPLAQRLAHQQIFNRDYAHVWERYLEATYTRHGPNPDGKQRGGLAESLSARIGVEDFPPGAAREKAEWLFDFVCPVPDLSDPREVELLLSAEEPSDVETVALHLRQMREFARLNTDHARRNVPDVLSEEASRLLLCQLWGIASAQLARACRSRGIPNIRTAVRILQPFIVGAIKERKHLRAESA